MLRIAMPCLAALLVAGSAYAAPAPDGADSVLHDCGVADLPPDLVDSCLERVRVLDESNPSPSLQSLEVKLSQMEAKRPPRSLSQTAPPPEDVQDVPPAPPAHQAMAPAATPPAAQADDDRDTSDDDINPADGPPTDADMHPYSRDSSNGGGN